LLRWLVRLQLTPSRDVARPARLRG